jgi:hypothetical protein
MGVSIKTLYRLLHLKALGLVPAKAAILELGAQNVRCKGNETEVEAFIKNFHCLPAPGPVYGPSQVREICDCGTMAALMELCGYSYKALDIFDSQDTMLFDLNCDDVPADMAGAYNLVTNFGTTEHILNQFKAFDSIHRFTKVGGVMYHDVPLGGYFFHGYFSYNPMFFLHLALANKYAIVGDWYSKAPNNAAFPSSTPQRMRDGGWPDTGFHDAGIEFALQKTEDQPFRIPVDTGTSNDVDLAFVQSRSEASVVLPGSEALAGQASSMSAAAAPLEAVQPTVPQERKCFWRRLLNKG